MPVFDKSFYYPKKSTESDYRSQPPGQFDVHKLLSGDPCWRADPKRIPAQKTIVFTGDQSINSNNLGFHKRSLLMNNLFDAGFTVYQWNAKTLEPVTIVEKTDKLEIAPQDVGSKAELIEDIVNEARKKKIDIGELYVLDASSREKYSRTLTEATLYSSDFENKEICKRFALFSTCLAQQIKAIVIDKFSVHTDTVRQELALHFAGIPISEQYHCLYISEKLMADSERIRKICLNHTITSVNFYETCSQETVNFVLNLTPAIQSLAIDKADYLDTKNPIPFHNLKQLKKFVLSSSNLNAANLSRLLENTTELEILNLFHCGNILGPLQLKKNSLPNLRKLFFLDVTIDQGYQALLQASPTLRFIALIDVGGVAGSAQAMNHLKEFYLGGCHTSSEGLSKILKSTPHLLLLKLINFTIDNGNPSLTPNALKDLRDLCLNKSNVGEDDLANLLLAAPQVERIGLWECSTFEFEGTLTFPDLCHLRALRLQKTDISIKFLSKLLNSAPNLEELYLDECTIFDEELTLIANRLAKLRSLSIRHSDIKPRDLVQLFNAATHLTSLDIEGCQNLDDELNLASLAIEHLEVIDLRSTHLSFQNFLNLLDRAPNLKELVFDSHQFTEQEIQQLKEKFPHIELDSRTSDNRTLQNSVTKPAKKVREIAYDLSVHFRPEPVKPPFVYRHSKKYNQNMISMQLAQYLTLKNKDLDLIDSIRDGICYAMSTYFLSQNTSNRWSTILNRIQEWNGSLPIPDQTEGYLEEILQRVKTPQKSGHYVGDNLSLQLLLLKNTHNKLLISNPWHTTAVQFDETTQKWVFYDPNFESEYTPAFSTIHELVKEIKQQIGSVITLLPFNAQTSPNLIFSNLWNMKTFIAGGGLIDLYDLKNAEDLLDSFAKNTETLNKKDLAGLLLLSTKNIPAWAICLNSKNERVVKLAMRLLLRLCAFYGDTALISLEYNLSGLTGEAQEKYLQLLSNRLIAYRAENSEKPYLKELLAALRSRSRKKDAKQRFQTWHHETPQQSELDAYVKRLSQADGNIKRLIKFNNQKELHRLALALESHCQKNNQPVFYVNSPRELQTQGFHTTKDEKNPKKGVIHKGFGGAFYKFLQSNKDSLQAPVLIINYDNFTADDIVGLNSLIDKSRKADGIELPKQLKIIGLIDPNKPNCYQGSDFYSRFNKAIEYCPVPNNQLIQANAWLHEIDIAQPPDYCFPIQLYHAKDWKLRLLGRWIIQGNELAFEEGILKEALESGKPLHIANGLWDSPEFHFFWQQAISRGYIDYEGQRLTIPSTFSIYRSEGYDWNSKVQAAQLNNTSFFLGLSIRAPFALYNNTFTELFVHYLFQDGLMYTKPGFIEQKAGAELHINIMEQLSDDQWAMLLDECKKHQVKLVTHFAPSIAVPQVLHSRVFQANETPASTPIIDQIPLSTEQSRTRLIVTNDMDVSIHRINQQKKHVVIDISECLEADLLLHIHPEYLEDSNCFQFTKTFGVLHQAMQKNEPIILKGRFSEELALSLTQLMIKRIQQVVPSSSSVIMITDQKESFVAVPTETHQVSAADKLNYLHTLTFTQDETQTLSQVDNTPSCKLRAQLSHKRRGDIGTSSAWDGYKSLPSRIPIESFDPLKAEEQTQQFIAGRRQAINQTLQYEPFAFITGITGVGKSTFMAKHLPDDQTEVYSYDKLEEWLKPSANHIRKILFIDEANIGNNEWSEVEGLYNDPPGIRIRGKFHPLSADHKVVFAGNPITYGAERKLAPIFVNHGNAVVFQPMPPAYIHTQILTPIFAGDHLTADQINAISKTILDVYQYIGETITHEVAISPRELEMMAMLTRSYLKSNPSCPHSPQQIAQHYAYKIGSTLLTDELKKEFDQKFKPPFKLQPLTKLKDSKDLVLTDSLESVGQLACDLLNLRELRQNPANNDSQKYAGLGGMIIEGEPGIGKTILIQQVLQQKKIDHVYIDVYMDNEQKQEKLLDAFEQGKVVVIEEINSSPMLEKLLNDLLMGKRKDNSRPTTPGFMVFGTQNPISMAGRQATSPALARRLITAKLNHPSVDEMEQILEEKDIPQEDRDDIINVYQEERWHALYKGLQPAPCFRDLIDYVDETYALDVKDIAVSSTRYGYFNSTLVPPISTASVPFLMV